MVKRDFIVADYPVRVEDEEAPFEEAPFEEAPFEEKVININSELLFVKGCGALHKTIYTNNINKYLKYIYKSQDMSICGFIYYGKYFFFDLYTCLNFFNIFYQHTYSEIKLYSIYNYEDSMNVLMCFTFRELNPKFMKSHNIVELTEIHYSRFALAYYEDAPEDAPDDFD
jgi:hypothetical protein